MPSPIGHVIAGVAAAWLVAGAPRGRGAWREACVFGALGAAPDLDLLVGAHSGPTHSIGAAALVGAVAFVVRSRVQAGQGVQEVQGVQGVQEVQGVQSVQRFIPGLILFALACAAAYGSHILLDWLARDSTPPIGIMALWPFSQAHYESNLHLFMAISRRYYQGWVFVRQNTLAILRELVILIPVLILIVLFRPRPMRRDEEP